MTMRRSRWACDTVFYVLIVLAGCGASVDVDTVSVSGRVTLDGKALANAHISFEPVVTTADDMSVGSYARTDADGNFTLLLVTTGQPGAMPGRQKVRITTARPVDPSREDSLISPELATLRFREGVEIEVPEQGTDGLDFAMRSEP